MIAVSIRLAMTPDRGTQAVSILRSLLEPTRVMRGCSSFTVYRDLEDPNALLLIQRWECTEDLARYVRGRDFQQVLAVIELAEEPPEIAIDTVAATQGMEFIEELSDGR